MITKTKFAQKATVNAQRAKVQPVVEAAFADSQTMDDVLDSSITSRRLLIANIAWLVSFGATYYWTASVIAVLSAASVLFTGSMFIGWMISFIGGCIAIIGAWKFAKRVFAHVVEFDLGSAQSVIDVQVSRVRSVFARTTA